MSSYLRMPTSLIHSSKNGIATMIKVLLINPPQTFYDASIGRTIYFPLGLMYLGAVVRDICHVEIFDCLTSEVEPREGNSVRYVLHLKISRR